MADARPGDVVLVTEILFDLVRDHCWELGIRPGEVFVCGDRHGDRIRLQHDQIGLLVVELDRARFISVERTVAVA